MMPKWRDIRTGFGYEKLHEIGIIRGNREKPSSLVLKITEKG